MTVPVKVYTTPICPYCSNAKQLLKTKGVAYEEIGMHDISSEERQALMKKTNNYRTVPQIFVGDTFVGGFDELNQMNQQGKLDELLAG
ncbi:glutaredoxin 3 [Psychrobacter sp. NZS113]|jgi:glutaredoxin 3|uniref:glutaredoxin 3 n=1 Tax=Psychrobacter sp. NZS113 TaxID=2792045 RepID=UPI0018CC86EE|nr:glutaredoxin 3 [Psychrobacter sp. NZS113]MBH0096011.1 glutaredoxin 3 [Psychrobacter sp. NZS113]